MKPDSIYQLVQELKRRRVFRGIIVYGASTLILLEAAQNISNVFGLETAPKWFVWLLGIGFLGSLWFSWIYDFTPGGIKKTEPSKEHQVPIPPKEVRTYKITTFLSVVIIIGLLTYNIIDGANKKKIQSLDKSIAVLPLEETELNYNETLDLEFIGQEITSCLLKVKEYRVVPWENCRRYKRKGKLYPEIGRDLSAAILVDWTPYDSKFQKRLSVNLIAASDHSLLWAENFKIEGNWSDEICKHSRKISKKITRKLRTYLTPEERALIDEQPVSAQATMFASIGNAITQDAWEMVQTGTTVRDPEKNEYTDSISFDRAITYFTEAIKADPSFAEAYANRAKARLLGIRAGYFDTSVLDKCREDIENAFDLQRELSEAHVAMGFYYYYGLDEYNWALTSFEKAVELRPNNNEYLYYLSVIRRALGDWENVLTLSNKVFASNPRNVLFLINLGFSYLYLNDISRSIVCFDRAIELMPQWDVPYVHKIYSHLSSENINEAKKVVREAEKTTDKDYYRIMAELNLYEEKYSSAVKNIEQANAKEFYDHGETEGDAFLLKAKIYKYAGDLKRAEEYFMKALDYFGNRIKFDPQDYYAFSKLGITYAGIGLNQIAIEHGRKALEFIDPPKDALTDPDILYDMIQTYAITGNHESGQNMIKELLDRKSRYSLETLKLDPDIKQLFNDTGNAFINH